MRTQWALSRPRLLVSLFFSLGLSACDSSSAVTAGSAGASGNMSGSGSGNGAFVAGGRCDDESPDAKTIKNRYFCLPQGARCAGMTLPCCTFECQSNDGRDFNPDDDPALYLKCDTTADECILASQPTKHSCSKVMASSAAACAGGALQCGRYGPTVGCCPPETPYTCATSDLCFSDAYSADEYCVKNGLGFCKECIPMDGGSSTAGSGGGGGVSGGACPCESLGNEATSACAPDPLAPACYCAQAYVNDCLAENAMGCMADASAAMMEASRLRQAAIEENGSCRPP